MKYTTGVQWSRLSTGIANRSYPTPRRAMFTKSKLQGVPLLKKQPHYVMINLYDLIFKVIPAATVAPEYRNTKRPNLPNQ